MKSGRIRALRKASRAPVGWTPPALETPAPPVEEAPVPPVVEEAPEPPTVVEEAPVLPTVEEAPEPPVVEEAPEPPVVEEAPEPPVVEEAPSILEPSLSILDNTVGALKESLATGEYDAYLDELEELEKAGKNRKGALAAIEERRT